MHYARSISATDTPSGDAEANADLFALLLDDTSASAFSRAKSFLSTMATMRLFGGSRAQDASEVLTSVVAHLAEAGFEVVGWDGPDGMGGPDVAAEAASAAAMGAQRVALLLVRPTLALLRREVVKEELECWLREHARAPGLEFTPVGAGLSRADLTPARRVALAAPILAEAAMLIRRELSRAHAGALTLACEPFAVHDRAFNSGLLRHLLRHWRLGPAMLHSLRNSHGEKVAFHFAFASFFQARAGVFCAAPPRVRSARRCSSRRPWLLASFVPAASALPPCSGRAKATRALR